VLHPTPHTFLLSSEALVAPEVIYVVEYSAFGLLNVLSLFCHKGTEALAVCCKYDLPSVFSWFIACDIF
jgi:hypothetical protein